MNTVARTSGKLVGALVSGLAILRYLADRQQSVGVSKIAKDLSLNPSTCFNLLKTLVHEGLVSFNEHTKTYAVGSGLFELSHHANRSASSVVTIHPHLKDIASKYGVTTTLWQRTDATRVTLLDIVHSDSAVQVHMSVGQRLPTYIAALGRCMAANSTLTKLELQQEFKSLRWQSAPSFTDYLRDVDRARKDGYAVDHGNYVKGVTTISAAIKNHEAAPVMAISAVGFSAQLSSGMARQIGQALHRAATQISDTLFGAKRRD